MKIKETKILDRDKSHCCQADIFIKDIAKNEFVCSECGETTWEALKTITEKQIMENVISNIKFLNNKGIGIEKIIKT